MTSFIEKGGFLEHCLDGLEHLPPEINRSFALMNDLDERVENLEKEIQKREDEYERVVASLSPEERQERLAKIADLFREAKVLSEEKVQLSIHSYELVDKHIRKLDKEIADFECEVKQKCGSMAGFPGYEDPNAVRQPPDVAQTQQQPQQPPGKKGRKSVKAPAPTAPAKDAAGRPLAPIFTAMAQRKLGKNPPAAGRKRGRRRTGGEESADEAASGTTPATSPSKAGSAVVVPGLSPASLMRSLASETMDMPVDPNEPTYCICNQVSYGEMVGCDNVECPVEWFHFPCMNLTSKPKGKWWCPQCAPKFDPNYKPPEEPAGN